MDGSSQHEAREMTTMDDGRDDRVRARKCSRARLGVTDEVDGVVSLAGDADAQTRRRDGVRG